MNIKLRVTETPLPATIKGATAIDKAGGYDVLINSNLGEEEKTLAFIHEMLHIWHNDFNTGLSLPQKEALRHSEAEIAFTSVNNH